MTLNDIKDIKDLLIICGLKTKKIILDFLDKDSKFFNIKFFTEKEFLKLYYYSYDERALYYIKSKYNIKIDLAKLYLDNLIYVQNHLETEKLKFLNEIKSDLENNNLLIINNEFKKYLKNKNILYDTSDISYFLKSTLESNQDIASINYIDFQKNTYEHKVVELNSIEEEVMYVASSICELLRKNISINNIKLINTSEEYYPYLKRIFNFYNIPINLKNNVSIYSTLIGKFFIDNYSANLESVIKDMLLKFDNRIVSKIVNIVNNYAFVEDKNLVKEFIMYDLKNTYIPSEEYTNAVAISEINYFNDNEYVFLLSFNQKYAPKVYSDDDFFTDDEKKILNIESSVEKNKETKKNLIKFIESTKNLCITYKLFSLDDIYFPSLLIDEMNLKVVKGKKSFNDSNMINKVYLCKLWDKFYKYHEKSRDLAILKTNYDINYRGYNNKFTGISLEDLKKITNNKLNLSYSSMQKYNECAFKYYLDNILHLSVYEDTFAAFLGTLFHHVLEIGLQNEINVSNVINDFVKGRDFTFKEKFYIEKIKKDIVFALDVIKKQAKYSSLTNIKTENEFKVLKKGSISVTFKGFIDKMLYQNEGEKVYVAVIDYKTYDTDIKMDLLDYGLNIQLPVYLYLVRNDIKNAIIVGFYLQKVLPTDNKYDEGKSITDRKEKSMKLSGFSNNDENILKKFDSTYTASKVIKGLKINNDGNFSESSHVLSNEDMDKITNKVENVIDKCINNIENCQFDVNPKIYKNSNISCTYCKYNDVCFKTFNDEVTINVGGDENA